LEADVVWLLSSHHEFSPYKTVGIMFMNSHRTDIQALHRELRASMGDRNKLSGLHSLVTKNINNAFGEEKEQLVKFRQEVKDALNCRVLDDWGAR
jgi:hypothetical protein